MNSKALNIRGSRNFGIFAVGNSRRSAKSRIHSVEHYGKTDNESDWPLESDMNERR